MTNVLHTDWQLTLLDLQGLWGDYNCKSVLFYIELMLIMAFLFNVLREIAHELHEFSRNWESIKVFVFYYITNFHLTVNYFVNILCYKTVNQCSVISNWRYFRKKVVRSARAICGWWEFSEFLGLLEKGWENREKTLPKVWAA